MRGRWPSGAALRRGAAIGLGALFLGASSLGCGSDGGGGAEQAPPGAIETGDFFFEPQTARARVGETVRWFNTGEQLHNVRGAGIDGAAFGTGEGFEHVFRRPGTYRYICSLHPTQMSGTVVVSR